MRVITCESYDEMSCVAAKIFESQLLLKPNSVLGLATGSTPIGLYANLVEKHKQGKIDFSLVKTFNLDEYYPISPTNPQSYYYFMNEHLYSKVNLRPENIHIPNGQAEDANKECAAYEEMIQAAGGIDLQVLGIGQNGHIAFNEPDTHLKPLTHKTPLTQDTIQANARFFESADQVPTTALTVGMKTILSSKKIVLLANGENKTAALEQILAGEISTQCPASFLNLHDDTVVIRTRG